jgi:hypothetical protein
VTGKLISVSVLRVPGAKNVPNLVSVSPVRMMEDGTSLYIKQTLRSTRSSAVVCNADGNGNKTETK